MIFASVFLLLKCRLFSVFCYYKLIIWNIFLCVYMEELPRYLVAEFPCLSFRGRYQISRCAHQVLVPPGKYEHSFVSHPCQLMASNCASTRNVKLYLIMVSILSYFIYCQFIYCLYKFIVQILLVYILLLSSTSKSYCLS